MTKKKPLAPELRAECEAANAIFLAKMNQLGLTKSGLAAAMGVSGPAVGYFLDGTNQLNAKFAAVFSRAVGEPVEAFSKRLAEDIRDYRKAVLAHDEALAEAVTERVDLLSMVATLRSKQVLERIAQAAAAGRLTDDDLDLLDKIATKFEGKAADSARPDLPAQTQRLREELKRDAGPRK